jgi:hypothetical protein
VIPGASRLTKGGVVRTFRIYVLDDYGRVNAPPIDLEAETVKEVTAIITPQANGSAFKCEGRDMVLHVKGKSSLRLCGDAP